MTDYQTYEVHPWMKLIFHTQSKHCQLMGSHIIIPLSKKSIDPHKLPLEEQVHFGLQHHLDTLYFHLHIENIPPDCLSKTYFPSHHIHFPRNKKPQSKSFTFSS